MYTKQVTYFNNFGFAIKIIKLLFFSNSMMHYQLGFIYLIYFLLICLYKSALMAAYLVSIAFICTYLNIFLVELGIFDISIIFAICLSISLNFALSTKRIGIF